MKGEGESMNGYKRRSKPDDVGQGIVEFALVLPLLLFVMFGIIEFGRLLFIYSAVFTSSRDAARYGSAAGDLGNYQAHYQDCNGMRAAAKRFGTLVGIEDSNISIDYYRTEDDDDDPSTPDITVDIGDCPIGGEGPSYISLGDRVVVHVQALFDPILPLLNVPAIPISSRTSRTIIRDVSIEGTPPPPSTVIPEVYIYPETEEGDEASLGEITVWFIMSSPTTRHVFVPFSLSGTATLGDDYTINRNSPVVIEAGTTRTSVTITVLDDEMDEWDETIRIVMGIPDHANSGMPTTHTTTIIDDDPVPYVSFTSITQSGNEGDGSMQVVAQLFNAIGVPVMSGKDIFVPYSAAGLAQAGADYTLLPPGQLYIAPYTPSATLTIGVIDDLLYEDDEDVVISMGAIDPDLALPGTITQHTAWIINDDPLPEVSFTWDQQEVVSGTDALIEVQLNAPSGKDVIVPFAVTDSGTVDYSIGASPVLIPLGQTVENIQVTINNDDDDDTTDDFIEVTLLTPTDATLVSPFVHTIVVTDTIPLPTVYFTAGSQSEMEDIGVMTVVAELDAPYPLPVEVPLGIGEMGTAEQNVDYSISGTKITIPANGSSASVDINVINDSLDEADETVVLAMGKPANAILGSPATHVATIRDDESNTVAFTFESQSKTEDSGSLTVTAQLTNLSSLDVTVPLNFSGTATQVDDYTISATQFVIPAGVLSESIEVTLVNDTIIEPDETIILTMGTPQNAGIGSPSIHTAYISDDDVLSCPTLSTLGLYANSPKLSLTVYNTHPSAIPVVITGLTANWSDNPSQQKLQTVTLGGVNIWSGNDNNPPSYLPSEGGWKSGTTSADRSLDPGISKDIVFFFANNLDLAFSNYFVTVHFDNGCPPVSTGGG
jgi:hypothetical protein